MKTSENILFYTWPPVATMRTLVAWHPVVRHHLATHVDEEGVLIDNFKLVKAGIIDEDRHAQNPDRAPMARP